MKKADVLKSAKENNLNLSSDMFERYFQHGLIVSNKDGQGYFEGVNTFYHDRTLDAIKEINKLKQEGSTPQKDMIFILAWEGYPIQWDKLKTRLIEYQTSVIGSLQNVATYSTHPEFQDIVHEYVEKSVEKPKAIGRPSKAIMKHHEEEVELLFTRSMVVIKMIKEIMQLGQISKSIFSSFSSNTHLSEILAESTHVSVNYWLSMNTLLNVAIHSEEHDYQQCIQILPLLKDFWDVLISCYGQITNIPIIGKILTNIQDSYHFDLNDEPSQIFKLMFLFLLRLFNRDNREELIELLSNREVKIQWKQFCGELVKGGEAAWETLVSH